MSSLWEILVPTEKRVPPAIPLDLLIAARDGDIEATHRIEKWKHYSTRYHKVWDAKVRAISGGLTIMAPVKGQWTSNEGDLFKERMIPVRIMATREQIEKIIDFTIEYYDQLAVLCYKLSDEVILKHRES
jgi:hypothetical protein